MSYKVEELLALRDSVSESAVSIDRFADEDVIKGQLMMPTAKHLPPPFHLSTTHRPRVSRPLTHFIVNKHKHRRISTLP
jgi:hypothetical protein